MKAVFRCLDGAVTRVWRALFRQGNLRLWAIILGAPFLCGGAVWLVYLIRYGWPEDRAEQQLTILGFALYGVLTLIAVVVIALSTVRVRATIPAGSLDVGGSPDLPYAPEPERREDRRDRPDRGSPWPPRRAAPTAPGQLPPDERLDR